MADSFGSINFTVLAAGMQRVQSAAIAVTHIPGGTVSYVDYGGQTLRELGYDLLLTEVAYGSLEAVVGGTATLTTTVDGTISSALLQSLARRQRVPVSGTTIAVAAFAVVVA